MPRKRSFQDTFNTEENNHSDNVKKKKNSFKTEADAISNNLKKNDKVVSPNPSKLKTSKINSLFKVKFSLNNENNKTTKLKTNNDLKTAKTNGNTKFITSVENKSTKNIVDEPSNKLEGNNNLMTSKTIKSKSDSSIETKSVSNNRNNNDIQTDFLDIGNDIETLKTSIKSVKTKYRMRSMNKNRLSKIAHKRDYCYLLNKTQQPNCNEVIIDNHGNKVEYSFKKASGMLQKYEPQSPTKYDNSKMLRSKPLKMRKKWRDKWGRNRLSNRMLKSNNKKPKFSKKKLNNRDNTIKKALKLQKPKTSNCEKLKTNESLIHDNTSNIYDIGKKKTSSIDKTQNCDAESVITGTAVIEPSDSCHGTIMVPTESTELKPVKHGSESTFLSDVSILPPSTDDSPPSVSSILPSTSSVPLTFNTSLLISVTLPSTSTTLLTSSTIPTTFTEISSIVDENENNSQPHLMKNKSINNTSYVPVAESEISYGINILSEAVIRQCNESTNNITTNSVEQSSFEIKSPKQNNSSPQSKLPNAQVLSKINNTNKPRRSFKRLSRIRKQSIESKSQLRIDHDISLLSKRFNIPIDDLKKTVIDEPLAIFQSKFSPLITPSMVTVSPIVQKVISNSRNPRSKKLDIQFKVEPIRECKAYEKNNLIDLMAELSKTMPSWSLCITTNPPRYVISHTIINKYGAPYTDKSIVLDEYFKAYVYINQCLENAYCKRYVTANEIVNLIKDLHSL